MSFRFSSWAATMIVAMFMSSAAQAQFYGGGGCSSCGTAAPAPVMSMASCQPVQPVACYQTVPVTTYKKERVTVRRPYYRTEYEDREVTVMEPVTRQRTVEIPTVSYQTVMENRTVHRDLGKWQTNYHPIAKCAPCQIDPRPGLMGWLNRTGYAFRNSLTPNYRTSRQYVPNMVACNVPVTRQVAVRGTQKVVQNFTEMVARKKTERVAVQKLDYKEEVVTVNRPVTAYRTVPIGSTLAYGGFGGYATNRMAWIVDDDSTATAKAPEPDPAFSEGRSSRTARTFEEDLTSPKASEKDPADGAFRRTGFEQPALSAPIDQDELQRAPRSFGQDSGAVPVEPSPNNFPNFDDTRRSERPDARMTSRTQARKAVVASGWTTSRSARQQESVADSGLRVPQLSQVDR